MSRYADIASPRFSPARTLAISIALVLHASAFTLLLAPMRAPDRAADRLPPEVEWVMPERLIPPPPLPPVVPITPPRQLPIAPRRPLPPAVIPNPEPAQALSDVVPDTAPPNTDFSIDPVGSDAESFVPGQIGALSYLDAPAPRYPQRALTRRIEGDVLLRVTVGDDGRPQRVELQRSSGHALLDRAAIEQVQKRWRFRPLIIDGRPSRAVGLVPIRFVLAGR